MYDRGLGVLEQYGLTAETVLRGRGALICQTEEGWKSIREYWAPPEGWSSSERCRNTAGNAGFFTGGSGAGKPGRTGGHDRGRRDSLMW